MARAKKHVEEVREVIEATCDFCGATPVDHRNIKQCDYCFKDFCHLHGTHHYESGSSSDYPNHYCTEHAKRIEIFEEALRKLEDAYDKKREELYLKIMGDR